MDTHMPSIANIREQGGESAMGSVQKLEQEQLPSTSTYTTEKCCTCRLHDKQFSHAQIMSR